MQFKKKKQSFFPGERRLSLWNRLRMILFIYFPIIVGGFYIVHTENGGWIFAKACSTHFDANYTLTPSFCKMISNNIIFVLDLPNSLNFAVCRLNFVHACA